MVGPCPHPRSSHRHTHRPRCEGIPPRSSSRWGRVPIRGPPIDSPTGRVARVSLRGHHQGGALAPSEVLPPTPPTGRVASASPRGYSQGGHTLGLGVALDYAPRTFGHGVAPNCTVHRAPMGWVSRSTCIAHPRTGCRAACKHERFLEEEADLHVLELEIGFKHSTCRRVTRTPSGSPFPCGRDLFHRGHPTRQPLQTPSRQATPRAPSTDVRAALSTPSLPVYLPPDTKGA